MQSNAFAFLLPEISTWGLRVKCALFVYASHSVHSPPDRFPLPSVYQLVLICAFESESMISCVFFFFAGREGKGEEKEGRGGKLYPFDLAGKNMGSTTESHLLCQLFCRRGDIPMGTRFLLRESQSDQCGPCLIWP